MSKYSWQRPELVSFGKLTDLTFSVAAGQGLDSDYPYGTPDGQIWGDPAS